MRRGFTLVEMIVVMAIGMIVLTATTVILLGGQRRVVRAMGVEQLVAEIRTEQMRSMMGDTTAGAGVVDLGALALDNNLTVGTTFPGARITFVPISGEVEGYAAGNDTVTVVDSTDGTTKTLHINGYGVVTQVD